MLKTFLLLSAAILFGAAPSPALPHAAGQTPQEAKPAAAAPMTNPVKPTAESQERAKRLYDMDCAMCHGTHGDGKTDLATQMQVTPPDWTDAKTLAGTKDDELFNAIRNGKGKMPAEPEDRAKDNDVWNLILYIRDLSKSHADKPGN